MSDAALVESFHDLLNEAWSDRDPGDEADFNSMNDDVQDIVLTMLEIYMGRVGPPPRPGRYSALILSIAAPCAWRQSGQLADSFRPGTPPT